MKHIIASSLGPAFLRLDLPGTAGRLVKQSGQEMGKALELTTVEGLAGLKGLVRGGALEEATAERLVGL